MQEQDTAEYSKFYAKKIIDYIQDSYNGISKMEARATVYLGKYEIDSQGDVVYFPDGCVKRQYQKRIIGPKSGSYRYHGRLNLSNDAQLYETIIEFHIVNALQSACPEILANIPKTIVEYNLFIDTEDNEIIIRHGIRVGKQLIFVLDHNYELKDVYFTNDFFKPYKNSSLTELKEVVLFFVLYAYNAQMRSIMQDVNIYNLSIEQMKQYITLVDIIKI